MTRKNCIEAKQRIFQIFIGHLWGAYGHWRTNMHRTVAFSSISLLYINDSCSLQML